MDELLFRTFAKMAVRWHRYWLRLDTAKIEKRLEKGEPYTSPKLAKLSSQCAAHGMKAVQAAKKGGFYKRGRMVDFPVVAWQETELEMY